MFARGFEELNEKDQQEIQIFALIEHTGYTMIYTIFLSQIID